jgi:hypothetical protein
MRRVICAVYVERWQDSLYYRKYNGITQFYYEHVSQRCGEAKHISISKSTPTSWTDAAVAFVFAVQYIISIKYRAGSMLVSAHASTVKNKIENETNLTDSTSNLTQPTPINLT